MEHKAKLNGQQWVKVIHSLSVIFFTSLLTASAHAVFPGSSWDESTPESQGMDSAKLRAALNYLAANTGTAGTTQTMVVRNGFLIWKGSDIDIKHNVWSVSKSFTSTILGLLIDDGLATLDTLVKDYESSLGSLYPNVKLRHFATMTSGYDAVGGNQSSTPFNPITPLFSPGAQYQYWDSAMNQFGNVLTQIAGEPMEDLFKRRIADLIQMNPVKWEWGNWESLNGFVVNGGAGNKSKGLSISASELTRLGHLFLNRGNWNGSQLISSNWVDQATMVQVPNTIPLRSGWVGPGAYGYNWWVNGVKTDGKRIWPEAPNKTYGALGNNNNNCFVIPEWNMVITRLGEDGNVSDAVWSTFFGKVKDAFSGGPLPG